MFVWMICIAEPFVTKPSMVRYYKPERRMRKLGFYLQGQGHSVGLYNQNMTVSTASFISSKPMILLQPNLIWW